MDTFPLVSQEVHVNKKTEGERTLKQVVQRCSETSFSENTQNPPGHFPVQSSGGKQF